MKIAVRLIWSLIGARALLQAQGPPLDAAERHRVIEGAIANLKRYYDRPDVGLEVAEALAAHERNGVYDAEKDGQAFANLLTRHMRDVSHDGQLVMRYSAAPTAEVPPRAPTPTPASREGYRRALEENHCYFEKVEILPHNIGYFRLIAFPDPIFCRAQAEAAMASLNGADAIIFDLRDNAGGYPKMVALLATYLFDGATHLNDMYSRADNSIEEFWTFLPVAGNKLADKPAYVLTSSTTFSAAEEFSYDLKMLKRATIVGEATSGRGHIPFGRRIDEHFEIRVPDRRSINPISKTDWDGPGVIPDVKVSAADALATAVKLAEGQRSK